MWRRWGCCGQTGCLEEHYKRESDRGRPALREREEGRNGKRCEEERAVVGEQARKTKNRAA
jgi:hypothetical protein